MVKQCKPATSCSVNHESNLTSHHVRDRSSLDVRRREAHRGIFSEIVLIKYICNKQDSNIRVRLNSYLCYIAREI